jgi:alginate O-acetyltransferase complex protein AlgI
MSAYFAGDLASALRALAVAVGTLALAFLVTRAAWTRAARAAAWGLAVLSVGVAHDVTCAQPAGFRMLVLIGSLFCAMKALVSVESLARDGTRLPPVRWAAFATLWPGMRPALVARLQPGRSGAAALVKTGLAHVALGTALFLVAHLTWRLTTSAVLATVLLLPALSFLLHFGAFGVLAGLWRAAGADVAPLFRAPWRSASLGEFWSRRWNLAFSEMTSVAVYRPLADRMGRRAALVAAFLFSGLLHEVAISLPVRAGFGRPLLYFAIHGVLTHLERERGPFGRAATLLAVVLPLPLLFHRPFLQGVIWPLLGPAR